MSSLPQAAAKAAPVSRSRAGDRIHSHRRWQLWSLIGADLLATNAAFLLAYHLRYTYSFGGDVPGESSVEYAAYLPFQLLFVGLCLLGYSMRGKYALPRTWPLAAEALSVLGTTAVAAMAVFAFASMVHYTSLSRLAFVYAWIAAFGLGVTGRGVVRLIRARAHRAGHGIERVIVVGSSRLARMVMQVLAQEVDLGCRILGFVDEKPGRDFGRFRALGTVQQLPTLIRQLEADRVIVALPAARHEEILQILEQCRADRVGLSLVPDLFELRLSHVSFQTAGGIPLLDLRDTSIGGGNLLLKRAMDVATSLALLIGLCPLLALIAVAIKLDSPGPIFFRQTRLGKNGVPFTCLKFRSMRTGAEREQGELEALNEAQGPIFKMRDDPRLTRVGRAIRRMSIDELPQLWNVLQGEMSLVGPRPPLPPEVERYEEWHRRRLEVVPGITGLWQVSGRSQLVFDEMVMLDLYYIENWSLSLDLQILARTIPIVLAARGAF